MTPRLILAVFTLLVAFAKGFAQSPVDPKASRETQALFRNLHALQGKAVLYGHQDDLAYGAGWKYEEGRSDTKDVTGDIPGILGFDLGRIELGWSHNLDSVPFDRIRGYILKGYEQGSVITISWHLNNPLTGKTAWDPAAGTVASILPGGSQNALYNIWLDRVASFLFSLRGPKGESIPVVLRLFHELNGGWFWWGKGNCTDDELKGLWRYTVAYLRDEKQLHQLLYAFNTDRFQTKEEYLQRYPGDEWVDVIGFDIYQRKEGNAKFMQDFDGMLTRLDELASEHQKIPALTEFGFMSNTDPTWWTEVFWKTLKPHRSVWALSWRNGDDKNYFMPFKGHPQAADFVKYYNDPKSWFGKDVQGGKLYR
jgi:hypothetical protein